MKRGGRPEEGNNKVREKLTAAKQARSPRTGQLDRRISHLDRALVQQT